MKKILTIIGFFLFFIALNLNITACGKKGDLIRPLPPEQQEEESESRLEE
jgi:predicted small lipoprotein YifL